MKRSFLALVLLLCAAPGPAAEAPEHLFRLLRAPGADLETLVDGGFAVVSEWNRSFLLHGGAGDLARLKAMGFAVEVLDDRPREHDYLHIGFWEETDWVRMQEAGTVVLVEDRHLLLRLEPGVRRADLADLLAFVAPLPRQPMRAPATGRAIPARGRRDIQPLVQQIVNGVDTARIRSVWGDLATNSPYGTRYSTSAGCANASTYCHDLFAGLGLPVQNQNHTTNHAPNVIATQAGAVLPDQVVIVVGHLDDMPSSGTAPGADDNASGALHALEAAQAMSCYAYKRTLKYMVVTGEEFGLYGSDYYADDAAARGENIVAVVNMDMPGWEGAASDPKDLDLIYRSSDSTWLKDLYTQCAGDYAGLLIKPFDCPSMSQSDHYPFWQNGYPAIFGITSDHGLCGGPDQHYPYYHQSTDTILNCGNGVDQHPFFYATVKASVATLAELAEPFKILLDRPSYACDGTLQITVGDRDLNTNAGTVQTTTVQVWSTTEPSPETVMLTEESADSMIFRGSFPLSALPAANGDGRLSVAAGEIITARYTDALDCNGAANVQYTTTAVTDCTAPLISNVLATAVTGNSAVITWTTDEAANSRVTYGTGVPPGTHGDDLETFVTSHSVLITGLAECMTYYFSVASADPAGNSSTANNGGSYYTFTTGKNTQPTYASTDVPKTIADNASVNSTLVVADNKVIQDVNVTIGNITHSYTGDVEIRLIGPDATTVLLVDNRGGGGDNFINTVFDDEAAISITAGTPPFTGSFRPEQVLTAFDGKNAAGTWTLRITDTASGDTGTLTAWSLTFTYPAAACGSHGKYNAHAAVADTCSGTGSGGGNGVWEAGETVQFSVTVENDGTDTLTGVVVTVTPVTPGVTMVDGTASYANIAVGATGTSQAPHFTAQLPTGLACGSTVQFSVSIATGQGTWSGETFTHAIGATSPGTFTLVNENFEGTWGPTGSTPPTGWSIIDNGSQNPKVWDNNDWHKYSKGGTYLNVARVNYTPVENSDEWLITPAFDLPAGATTANLEFDHYYNDYNATDTAYVDYSSTQNPSWTNLATYTVDSADMAHATISLLAHAGETGCKIRFRYVGNDAWYWQVDNVVVSGTAPPGCLMNACMPAAGGPPPVNHAGAGAAKFAKGAGQTLNVAYDAATCSAEKVVILYGALNDFTGYDGCAQSNGEADGTTTIDSTDHTSTWYNLVWVEGTTAGHPGFGTGGTRTWNAAGLCGLTADDKSHATCP